MFFGVVLWATWLCLIPNIRANQTIYYHHIQKIKKTHFVADPKPTPSDLLSAFLKFMHLFVMVLGNKGQNNQLLLDKMMVPLIQITNLLENNNDLNKLDSMLKNQMTQELLRYSHSISIIADYDQWRKRPPHEKQKDKEDIKKILGSFLGVIQNFFTIVQDPNNGQNVVAGLAGIFNNVVHAGKVIMKKYNISRDASEDELQKSVALIDFNLKKEILAVFGQNRYFIEKNKCIE